MKSVRDIVLNNSFFYRASLALFILIALFLTVFSRVDGFIILNSYHSAVLDQVFNSITFIGDGLFSIIVSIVILIFVKNHSKLAIIILVAYISSGIMAQLFKAIIYAPRPSLYFKLHHYNYYLDTFASSTAGTNSFPSGHSASVYALVTVFSIYFKRNYLSLLMIIVGILAGYSRIYLAHHFLIDVLAGMILGILFGSLSLIWLDNLESVKINAFLSKYSPFKNTK
jgi:membrane-associated phospholipid phosphatase